MPDELGEVDPPDMYSVRVGSGVSGHVVCGNNNVVITAGRESSITVGSAGPPSIRKRTRPVARPLPRPGGPLVGRDGELFRIDQALDEGRPVHVSGPAGCGKSALLRHVAARRAAADEDVVFLPASGLDVQDVIQELFQACYAADSYRPEPERLRRLMGSVRALVIVDDFGGSAQDFASLLDACPACDVVVASQDRLAAGDPVAVVLAGLGEADARDLLAGELARPLRTDELPAAHDLWQASNGSPRALVQAVAAVRVMSPAGVEPAAGLRAAPAVIASAIAARLTPAAGELLGLLSMLPGIDVPGPCLAALAGAETRPAAVTELTETRLVSGGPAGYRVTGGLSALVAERLAMYPDVAALAPNLVSWVRGTATLRQVAEAAPVIRRVLALCAEHGHHAAVVDLARIVAPVLQRTLRWGSWRAVLAVGGTSAARIGSAVDEAYFAHEENVRRRALGRAVVAGALLLGAGAVAGQLSSPGSVPAPRPGGAAKPGAGKSGLAIAKPLTVLGAAVVTIGVVVGGITFATQPTPTETAGRHSGIPVEVTTTTITTYSGQSSTTSDTGAHQPEPPPVNPPVSIQEEPPPPPPVGEDPSDSAGCTGSGANPDLDFGSVPYGEETTMGFNLHFRVEQCWPPEGADTADMSIEGEGFQLNPRDPAQCPSPTRANGSDECSFAITFRPTQPDRTDYTATLYIPVAAGQGKPATYRLVGTAAG